MNKSHSLLMVLLTGLALLLVSPDEAFAKRLGGGKSFGSRPSYSESYRPGPDVAPAYRAPQAAYQPTAQRNQAMRDSFRNRGGLMGMLGGLAVGGLLGAMLFGGGFEHINLFDIVVVGLAAYLLYRVFAARRRNQWGPVASTAGQPDHDVAADGYDIRRESARGSAGARFDTNVLFGHGRNGAAAATSARGAPRSIPAGFDESSFLAGAKSAYRHLQAAWDAGDLAELRALTTQPVFDELQRQLQQRSGPETTQVMSLDARVTDVSEQDSSISATVLFDAWVRESMDSEPARAREIWHFVRRTDSRQPTWFLDGIQQVED